MNVEQRRIQCWDIAAGYAVAQEKYKAGCGLLTAGFQEIEVWSPGLPCPELNENSYVPASNISRLRLLFSEAFGVESPERWKINSPLACLLHQYFQSEFAPCFCSMLKQGQETFGPKNGINESYLWHRDNGPSSHLKLVIYLNDDHDGATAVMSREDSRKFIDAGYLEGERLFHLDDFASAHGISYKPYKVQPEAGSGLIFEPTNVLHKGIYPTFGERRVFQIGIIPWGKPWESFYEEHWAKGYTNSNGFPRYVAGGSGEDCLSNPA